VIKASALMAAAAIGILVAGVLASSLLMVYVSIGVCAVAALILAAGIVTHWSEIFGRGEARPASVPGAWSGQQAGVGTHPGTASAVPTAVAGPQEGHARDGDAVGPAAGEQAAAVRAGNGFPVAGRPDDLWRRVEEELGSAGKRDTGALSWPATEIPAFREEPGSPGQATPPGKQGPRDASPAGTSGWIWGRGAGWQPPETSGPAWPPPAAAFAGSPARPEVAQDADGSAPDDTGPDGAGPEDAAQAAPDDAAAPADPEAASSGPAPEPAAAGPDAAQDRPTWIISLPRPEEPAAAEPASGAAVNETEGPATQGQPAKASAAARDSAASAPAGKVPPAREPEAAAAQDPVAGEPAASAPAGEVPPAGEAQPAGEPEAAAAQDPVAGEPAAAGHGGPAAAEPAAGPGRVEVTVVPGVARYHRSGCILIRFLGADDLEIMTRQEAEEASFVPCRACQPDQV
jgi:nicotinate-nucleotide--dimethylbenzimidazole phosphoribosyltransferase